MQPFGSMSEKVAMLMHRAALNRDVGPQCGKGFLKAGRTVDDGEFRRPPRSQVIEKSPPGGFGPRPCS